MIDVEIVKHGYNLPKTIIEEAIKNTDSMWQASQALGISYPTFKKYAKIYGLFKPLNSKTDKYVGKKRNRGTWSGYVQLGTENERKALKKILHEMIVKPHCNICGYRRHRVSDFARPLMVEFLDGDYKNLDPANIKLWCYNCWFIYYKYNRNKANKEKAKGIQSIDTKVSDMSNRRFNRNISTIDEVERLRKEEEEKEFEEMMAIRRERLRKEEEEAKNKKEQSTEEDESAEDEAAKELGVNLANLFSSGK